MKHPSGIKRTPYRVNHPMQGEVFVTIDGWLFLFVDGIDKSLKLEDKVA